MTDPAATEATGPSGSDGEVPREGVPVVGIGASAGGLEALVQLTGRLTTTGMAFVILQHLSPGHESTLAEILGRGSSLKVLTIQDGMVVEPDHIYVAPPNADLAIHHGVLCLITPSDRRPPRHPIDAFFRTLAADRGSSSIGVILSGAGMDGTLGLRAIKEEGGLVLVQEPSTAGQPSMPQSAIDAGCVDLSLAPSELADELVRLSHHLIVAGPRPPKLFDDESRSKLFVLLRGAFGVDFAAYKQTTIERRIQRRMALHRLDRLEDYLKYVQTTVAELNVLYSDLLIGVTRFFRDEGPIEELKELAFPRLVDNRLAETPIRIWVPGCSSGEEAYSIAITLLEFLGERAPTFKIQIFATDIDDRALTLARQAVYPTSIERDVAPERLARFFSPVDKGFLVNRRVRDMVVFARHNIAKDPPFSKIDLVSCRNVLIYMQPPLQRKVLRVFHYALNQGGFLLLGTSESVGEGSELFSLVDRKNKLYLKKNVATTAAFDLSFGGSRVSTQAARTAPVEQRHPVSVLHLADRKVLEQYGPPGVVVNDKFDILQYRGKTGRFFEPIPGVATVNLLKLARPELLPELRPALQRALAENTRVLSEPVRFVHDQAITTIRLDVLPLPDSDATGRTVVVLFTEERGDPAPTEAASASGALQASSVDLHLRDLERELETTKEYLQATIEDLESTNEELQSSNEELQSSNEELQSTNEELETSKEELQSTNEELVTLNEELQTRMAQLNVANDDLQNLLGAVSTAVLVVGADLRIRRFSAAAESLFNLTQGDVGRSVGSIRTVMRVRDIEQAVAEAIGSVSVREHKVHCVDGRQYQMRITPFRTGELMIRGAIVEFDSTGHDEAAEGQWDVRGFSRAVVSVLPHALALVDGDLRVFWANQSFLAMFRMGLETLGRPLEDLWSLKGEQPGVWSLIEDAVSGGRAFERVVIDKPFGHPLDRRMWLSARRLPGEGQPAALTLLVIEPVDPPAPATGAAVG